MRKEQESKKDFPEFSREKICAIVNVLQYHFGEGDAASYIFTIELPTLLSSLHRIHTCYSAPVHMLPLILVF